MRAGRQTGDDPRHEEAGETAADWRGGDERTRADHGTEERGRPARSLASRSLTPSVCRTSSGTRCFRGARVAGSLARRSPDAV